MFNSELLPIYLNDHLAGATAGRDLARRTAEANQGTEFGEPLADLAAQIDADRDQLLNVMGTLEVDPDQVKVGAGWLAEKLGRLKLNGRLVGYSPLSRVIEIEGLAGGVRAKLPLWRTLAAATPGDPRLAEFDFVHLIARAEEQVGQIDDLHTRAVAEMLAEETATR
jgi:hypothetical protein